MKNKPNLNLIVIVICLTSLLSMNVAYFLYYLPDALVTTRIKSISTPKEKKEDSIEIKTKFDKETDKKIDSDVLRDEEQEVVVEKSEPELVVPEKTTNNDYQSVERPTVSEILSANEIESEESIKIDSLGLHLNIIQGTNQENMLYGATTMLDGQKMGEGNYALAGHNVPNKELLFSPLLDIKKGAEIEIKNSISTFKYKVVEIKVIDYRDGYSVLKQTEKATLTLVTCDKPITTNGRFIVIAELI